MKSRSWNGAAGLSTWPLHDDLSGAARRPCRSCRPFAWNVGRPDRRPARHTGMKSRAICDLSKEKHTFIIRSLVTIKTAETLQNCGLNCESWRVVYCQKSNKAGARQIKKGSPLRHYFFTDNAKSSKGSLEKAGLCCFWQAVQAVDIGRIKSCNFWAPFCPSVPDSELANALQNVYNKLIMQCNLRSDQRCHRQ